MSKTPLVRATSAAIVLGAGVTLAPLAFAVPASAAPICPPGTIVITSDYAGTVTSCGIDTNIFGYPIEVVSSADGQITVTFGIPPMATLGFGNHFVFFFGGKRVVPTSTGTNGQGQPTATFPAGSVPGNGQGMTVQVVNSGGGAAQGSTVPAGNSSSVPAGSSSSFPAGSSSSVPAGNSSSVSSVPNGSSVAQDAISGTGTSYSTASSIDTGRPGDSSGPNAALIGGGAALVLVAVGGGVFMARRRHES